MQESFLSVCRSNPDAPWDALALLDQYKRRGRIEAELAQSLKADIEKLVFGVASPETRRESAPPNALSATLPKARRLRTTLRRFRRTRLRTSRPDRRNARIATRSHGTGGEGISAAGASCLRRATRTRSRPRNHGVADRTALRRDAALGAATEPRLRTHRA